MRDGEVAGQRPGTEFWHGTGPQVLAGCALALAATTTAWARHTGTPIAELIPAVIR